MSMSNATRDINIVRKDRLASLARKVNKWDY